MRFVTTMGDVCPWTARKGFSKELVQQALDSATISSQAEQAWKSRPEPSLLEKIFKTAAFREYNQQANEVKELAKSSANLQCKSLKDIETQGSPGSSLLAYVVAESFIGNAKENAILRNLTLQSLQSAPLGLGGPAIAQTCLRIMDQLEKQSEYSDSSLTMLHTRFVHQLGQLQVNRCTDHYHNLFNPETGQLFETLCRVLPTERQAAPLGEDLQVRRHLARLILEKASSPSDSPASQQIADFCLQASQTQGLDQKGRFEILLSGLRQIWELQLPAEPFQDPRFPSNHPHLGGKLAPELGYAPETCRLAESFLLAVGTLQLTSSGEWLRFTRRPDMTLEELNSVLQSGLEVLREKQKSPDPGASA